MFLDDVGGLGDLVYLLWLSGNLATTCGDTWESIDSSRILNGKPGAHRDYLLTVSIEGNMHIYERSLSETLGVTSFDTEYG